jgi:ribosomal protein S1
MEFKVVKINEAIKNAVVSHKALIESDLAEQREAIISSLEKGQVLEGVVKNITEFGAFMDLRRCRRIIVHHGYFMGKDQPSKRCVGAEPEITGSCARLR